MDFPFDLSQEETGNGEKEEGKGGKKLDPHPLPISDDKRRSLSASRLINNNTKQQHQAPSRPQPRSPRSQTFGQNLFRPLFLFAAHTQHTRNTHAVSSPCPASRTPSTTLTSPRSAPLLPPSSSRVRTAAMADVAAGKGPRQRLAQVLPHPGRHHGREGLRLEQRCRL